MSDEKLYVKFQISFIALLTSNWLKQNTIHSLKYTFWVVINNISNSDQLSKMMTALKNALNMH